MTDVSAATDGAGEIPNTEAPLGPATLTTTTTTGAAPTGAAATEAAATGAAATAVLAMSSTKPLTNGANKIPQTATVAATTTATAATVAATTAATTSNQAKLERHLPSNNNQHAVAEMLPRVSSTETTPSAATCASSPVASSSASCSKSDVDEVARLFEEKPEAFEKWLTERAPPEALSRLHDYIESRKTLHKRPSVTSDLFQQWMATPTLQQVSLHQIM
ncbi:GH14134 [Drosophila grimshawi]|uniref:GH14134 n=1 Tax=Drosophila grimshawi TaxID=7222 RepID=B4JXX6_DROGR|nr:GH14134 [Drosophila grimshawi]